MLKGMKTRHATNRDSRSVSVAALVMLFLLLVGPVYALSRLTTWVDWRLLAGAPLVLSILALLVYRDDKRRAEVGIRRIPESTLHLLELAGGWPGAFLAQRMFRHKISKSSHQLAFWVVVLIHQIVALDFLSGWRLTGNVVGFIRAQAA